MEHLANDTGENHFWAVIVCLAAAIGYAVEACIFRWIGQGTVNN